MFLKGLKIIQLNKILNRLKLKFACRIKLKGYKLKIESLLNSFPSKLEIDKH
jgi:hypothetical protein